MVISAFFSKAELITLFLVCSVTAIARLHVHSRVRQGTGYRGGFVIARVIHQDDLIDDFLFHDFGVRLAQSSRGIVSRHHDHDSFASKHLLMVECQRCAANPKLR